MALREEHMQRWHICAFSLVKVASVNYRLSIAYMVAEYYCSRFCREYSDKCYNICRLVGVDSFSVIDLRTLRQKDTMDGIQGTNLDLYSNMVCVGMRVLVCTLGDLLRCSECEGSRRSWNTLVKDAQESNKRALHTCSRSIELFCAPSRLRGYASGP